MYRFYLALVSSTGLVHSKHASWGKEVFPDDPRWPSLWNIRKSENSENDVEAKEFKICETAECKKVGTRHIDHCK